MKLRLATIGVMLFVELLTAACATKRTSFGEPIYFVGTSAYAKRVRGLTLSPDEAREALVSHLTERNPNPVLLGIARYHHIIVGDCFVFSYPRKIDVSLAGY